MKSKNQIGFLVSVLIIITLLLNLISCEDESYTIEYQNGYPNVLAGNWVAIEFQNATVVNDKIVSYDNISEPFDLVSALDPNSDDSLVFDNIYDSDIRIKVFYENDTFKVTKGKQLEVINHGQYGIYYVSIKGNYNYDEETGDYLTIHVGLYDEYSALFDTLYVVAFRKTGFEDIDYESLLSE